MPLYQQPGLDIQVWHFTKLGLFTVSSAYRVVMNELALAERKTIPTMSQGCYSFQLMVIWDLQVPP